MRKSIKLSLILAFVIFSVYAQPAESQSSWREGQTRGLVAIRDVYTNRSYGFSVHVPAGSEGFAQAPPSPDHSVRILLGEHRTIEMSAFFDAPLYGSTHRLMSALLQDMPKHHSSRSAITLGGRAAERVVVRNGSQIEDVVAQQRPQPGGDPINFWAVLTTTDPADERAFEAVLSSFTPVPRLP